MASRATESIRTGWPAKRPGKKAVKDVTADVIEHLAAVPERSLGGIFCRACRVSDGSIDRWSW